MNRTLVIIDMQPRFVTANIPRVVLACRREVEKAIDKNNAVVLVEYANSGETLPEIAVLLKGYHRYTKLTKWSDDGGFEICRRIREKEFPDKNILICGVNINACVGATVRTLRRRLPDSKLSIVANAINGFTYTEDTMRQRTAVLDCIRTLPVTNIIGIRKLVPELFRRSKQKKEKA